MNALRAMIIAVLMLALPLQGLAAFMPAKDCADSGNEHAAHATHNNHQNHHGAASQAHDLSAATDQKQDDTQSTNHANAHSCCHHVFTGAASATVPGTPAPPHDVTQRVSLLATLHIPEQPQRPPRA